MNIAIVTQPLRFNYGGIVQNFALQTILKRMGHTVTTLDGDVKVRNTVKNVIRKIIRKIIRLLTNKNGLVLGFWKYQSTTSKLSKYTKLFVDKYIVKKDINTVKKRQYDAFVVGSDQVWRPSYSNLDEAYLAFARKWKNIKRISYAASFGTDDWEYTETETLYCRDLINKFDAVSVREASAVQLCQDHFGVNAIHVLDPTMLLSKEDYIKEINLDSITQSPGCLFYYFLDQNDNKINLVSTIEATKRIKSFTVNSKVEQATACFEDRIQPPVENWLRAFYDAEFVITDSFHGCVFSMIFNKPFIVIANAKRGYARFESLLKLFGQNERLVMDGHMINDIEPYFELPNVNFEPMRKVSMDFLCGALNINQ